MLDMILNQNNDFRPCIQIDYLTLVEQKYIKNKFGSDVEDFDSYNTDDTMVFDTEFKSSEDSDDLLDSVGEEYSVDDFLNEFSDLIEEDQKEEVVKDNTSKKELPTFIDVCKNGLKVNIICGEDFLGRMSLTAENINELNHYTWRDWTFVSNTEIQLTKSELLKNILLL